MPLLDNDTDTNPRLKKAKLLCSIKSQIDNNGISETILDKLEQIQRLEKFLKIEPSKSMKSAYCAVAVECTVKHLSEYVDAVKRIWWGRLRESDFACDEMRVWKERIEGVVLGSNVCDEILSVGNLKDFALGLVRGYLGEAWAEIGPDLVVGFESGMGREREGRGGEGARSGLVVIGGGLGKQSRDLGVNEAINEADKDVEREPSVRDPGCNMIRAVASRGEDKDEGPPDVAPDTGSQGRPLNRDRGLIQKDKVVPKRKHVPSHRRAKGRVRLTAVQESAAEIRQSEYDLIPTPDVAKLQEELKRSCLELQAVVKDPLPDALREAQGLVSNLAKKNTNAECVSGTSNRCDTTGAKSSAHGGVETPQTGEADIQIEVERTAQTVEANIQVEMEECEGIASIPSGGNAVRNQSHSHQNGVSRCSLMERNNTAQAFEWYDSIDDSPERQSNRLKLPTPRRSPVSPLKKFDNARISRRRRKMWSNLEEDALRMGVQKFGKGNWKVILTTYRDIFEDRNEVDLKDKWRNLTR